MSNLNITRKSLVETIFNVINFLAVNERVSILSDTFQWVKNFFSGDKFQMITISVSNPSLGQVIKDP